MPLFGRKKHAPIHFHKKDMPKGLWTKCPQCNEIVYTRDIQKGLGVCPKCTFHFRMSCNERLHLLIEENSWMEWDAELTSSDPLQFTGLNSYKSKLEENQKKSNLKEAIICGKGDIGSFTVALGIMDFSFLGGSMGSVVGEKVTCLIEMATTKRMPLIIVSTSGGARMYEGLFSLMQMAKTSAALSFHTKASLPYISVFNELFFRLM